MAIAAIAAITLANLAPPGRPWWPALLAGTVAAAACGLRRWPRGRAWWALAGLCAGLLAGALAPQAPAAAHAAGVPVRFVLTVRDGWQAGDFGWSNRVRLAEVSAAQGAVPCAREVWLTLAGDAPLASLPPPGSRWEGSGELVYRPERPLRRPQLRVKSLRLLRPLAGGSWIDAARETSMQALLRAGGVDPHRLRAAGLAAALVLGRTDRLTVGEVDELRRSGLAHLLAVSGLNVGLVGAFVWGTLMLAGVPPGRRRWVVAAAMLAFAALAGWGAPVRRAAFGGAAYLTARQLGRPLLSLPVVWAIVAGLALFEPDAVLQAGFQLSAVVTLALVRWVEPLSQRLALLPRWAAAALAVALIGQTTSSPMVGQHFGTLSLLGVAANLAAAPVAFALTVLGLLALLAAFAAPWPGGLVLALMSPLHVGLDGISRAAAPGTIEFPAMPVVVSGVVIVLAAWGLTRARAAAAAALASALVWAVWLVTPLPAAPAGSEVRMLPVGEGMAVLLRRGGEGVLIDCGRSAVQAGRALSALRVRSLVALVLTHPDADHVGGAARVLERCRVAELVYPAAVADHRAILGLRRLARRRGVAELPVAAGQRVALGDIACDVLWPRNDEQAVGNDASLVARVELGGMAVLITGDLEAAGESALLASGGTATAEVLQLPHHGSATSSTAAFLSATRPRVALAASGTSPRFRYPDPAVIARVRRAGAVVLAQREGAREVAWVDGGDVVMLDGRVSLPVAGGGRRR